MFPVLRVGSIALETGGLIILLGVGLGTLATERAAERRGLPSGPVMSGVTAGLVAGLIGARLVYVFRYLPLYAERPLDALALTPHALSLSGGLLLGAVASLWRWRRDRVGIGAALDCSTRGLATVFLAIALSHLASGEAFGSPSEVPWAVEQWGAMRHPTPVYEALAAAGVLAVVFRRDDQQPGTTFTLWVVLASTSRLLIEAFRGDSLTLAGGLRQAQLAAVGVSVAALWAHGWLTRGRSIPEAVTMAHESSTTAR